MTENIDSLKRQKRQLVYSGASVLIAPFLYISLSFTDPIYWVTEKQELPFDTILYIGLSELLKLFCALWLFPTKDLLSPQGTEATIGTGLTIFSRCIEGDSKRCVKLPFVRKDAAGCRGGRTATISRIKAMTRFVEVLWGIFGFVIAVGICHITLILFGAPLIKDWLMTMELSFIIVCWLYLPLCLILPVGSILSELVFIKIWDVSCQPLAIGKWRFISSCVGIWLGAGAIPLDWDRPWQKFPLPCLFSAAFSHLLINACIFIYLINSIYRIPIREYLLPKKNSKIKSF